MAVVMRWHGALPHRVKKLPQQHLESQHEPLDTYSGTVVAAAHVCCRGRGREKQIPEPRTR